MKMIFLNVQNIQFFKCLKNLFLGYINVTETFILLFCKQGNVTLECSLKQVVTFKKTVTKTFQKQIPWTMYKHFYA